MDFYNPQGFNDPKVSSNGNVVFHDPSNSNKDCFCGNDEDDERYMDCFCGNDETDPSHCVFSLITLITCYIMETTMITLVF